MTPEEKAKGLYPQIILGDWMVGVKRRTFIEGANWMEVEKDKEIEKLKAEIEIYKNPLNQ